MSARVRLRAALWLALALASSGPALADSRVYRWIDDAGNVHITATPPPEGAQPAPAPAPSPAPPPEFGTGLQVVPETRSGGREETPEEPEKPKAAPAARADDRDEDPCSGHGAEIAAWLSEYRKLPPLEAAIERIESDPVLATASQTCPSNGPCTYSSLTREGALRRATEELRQAEQRVADAEEKAHEAGTPDRCLIDPGE